MLHGHTFTSTRVLAALLAMLALAAPTAFARPGGPASAAAAVQPSVYWSYEYEAGVPHPAHAVQTDDDGAPWTVIGGVAGACLLMAGTAGAAVRSRVRRAPAAHGRTASVADRIRDRMGRRVPRDA